MIELTTVARAKLNLTLEVVGRRADGYHDLRMVMQEIALGDQVTLRLGTGAPWRVESNWGSVPCDETNLAVKAARLFFQETGADCGGLAIRLDKRTPVCAGMGGGSSDGAAVLRLLYAHYGRPFPEERLYALAEQTGSDVPFALFGKTALAEGKGERLTRLPPMPECAVVLCKPPFPVSTPALFRKIDQENASLRPDTAGMLRALEMQDLAGVASRLGNAFFPVVLREHPEMEDIRASMLEQGALGASMTGSGPTMFGLFAEMARAQSAYERLKAQYPDTFLTAPV